MSSIKKTHFEVIFSLIMATYNRKEEVAFFVESLINQNFDLNKIELIIIDQNKNNLLIDIIEKYKNTIKIIHIKSTNIGTSINRNIGIKNSTGSIIAFPDDDCTYYRDTLSTVYNIFLEKKGLTTILGQIIDINGNKIIRNWPSDIIKITMNNFFSMYSQITIFTQCKDLYFDVNLGIGSKFGAYEDADYILSLLKANKETMYYYPDIKVSHPQLNLKTMPSDKIISYGCGFGAFCKKNLSFFIFILYLKVLIYHTAMLLLAILKTDSIELRKRYLSIVSRIKGFFHFNNAL